ncbi:hypothetical protein ACN47E_009396 [Coniothyrium glycines]
MTRKKQTARANVEFLNKIEKKRRDAAAEESVSDKLRPLDGTVEPPGNCDEKTSAESAASATGTQINAQSIQQQGADGGFLGSSPPLEDGKELTSVNKPNVLDPQSRSFLQLDDDNHDFISTPSNAPSEHGTLDSARARHVAASERSKQNTGVDACFLANLECDGEGSEKDHGTHRPWTRQANMTGNVMNQRYSSALPSLTSQQQQFTYSQLALTNTQFLASLPRNQIGRVDFSAPRLPQGPTLSHPYYQGMMQCQPSNVAFLSSIKPDRTMHPTELNTKIDRGHDPSSADSDAQFAPGWSDPESFDFNFSPFTNSVYTGAHFENADFANIQFLNNLSPDSPVLKESKRRRVNDKTSAPANEAYRMLPIDDDSIRLLRINSSVGSSSNAEMRCTLMSSSAWRTTEHYECLSYCWGDSVYNEVLYVRLGASDVEYAIPVTTNLYEALRALRDTGTSHWYWIDAVCINQVDVHERAAQVSIMKDIYSKASGVIIWLGDITPDSTTAVKFIKEISARFKTDTSLEAARVVGPNGLQLSSEHIDRLETYTMKTLGNPYKIIAQFFSMAWFRRVWVLQEAFSHTAVSVRFGEHVLPWGSIILAALWQSKFARANTASGEAGGIHSRAYLPDLWLGLLHTRAQRGLSMMELAARARDFEASDARDKVFALLGLANDLDAPHMRRPGLLPDYTKSKEEVYIDFAKDLIATTEKLDVLSLVNAFAAEPKDESTTSWMPDLDVPIATIRGLGFPRKYNASFSRKVQLETSDVSGPENKLLHLRGFRVDKVRYITEEIMTLAQNLRLITHDGANAIQLLWQNHVRVEEQNLSGEQLLQSFIELVTATGFALPTEFPAQPLGKVVPTRDVSCVREDFAAYWARQEPDFASFAVALRSELRKQAEEGDPDQFGVLAGKACHERKFFRTADGRMGLCPRHTRVGDVIAVLYGGSVPYVLREVRQERWRFVGECYVDGLMFGEAERMQRQELTFKLM